MTYETVLALDLSSVSSGWAFYDATRTLHAYGVCRPSRAGLSKETDLFALVERLDRMTALLVEQIQIYKPNRVVIEECNLGKSRFTQKVLGGVHHLLLARIKEIVQADRLSYVDSDGSDGWRSAKGLNLRLTKEQRKRNRGKKQSQKITQKDLAADKVKEIFGLDLAQVPGGEDTVDAICLGYFWVTMRARP